MRANYGKCACNLKNRRIVCSVKLWCVYIMRYRYFKLFKNFKVMQRISPPINYEFVRFVNLVPY